MKNHYTKNAYWFISFQIVSSYSLYLILFQLHRCINKNSKLINERKRRKYFRFSWNSHKNLIKNEEGIKPCISHRPTTSRGRSIFSRKRITLHNVKAGLGGTTRPRFSWSCISLGSLSLTWKWTGSEGWKCSNEKSKDYACVRLISRVGYARIDQRIVTNSLFRNFRFPPRWKFSSKEPDIVLQSGIFSLLFFFTFIEI